VQGPPRTDKMLILWVMKGGKKKDRGKGEGKTIREMGCGGVGFLHKPRGIEEKRRGARGLLGGGK